MQIWISTALMCLAIEAVAIPRAAEPQSQGVTNGGGGKDTDFDPNDCNDLYTAFGTDPFPRVNLGPGRYFYVDECFTPTKCPPRLYPAEHCLKATYPLGDM